MHTSFLFFSITMLGMWWVGHVSNAFRGVATANEGAQVSDELRIQADADTSISVFTSNGKQLVLRQVAKPGERPYIHPIYLPDGQTVVTEFRPGHHIHQTGLYWGLKRVNGRDYFMNGRGDYWKRVSMKVVQNTGKQVKWQTIYSLLDSTGRETMQEEHNWAAEKMGEKLLLDFTWKGTAKVDVHIGKFYVGGLFARMPWRKNRPSTATNANGLTNKEAEGQRAEWFDVGIQLKEQAKPVHMTILDHPSNTAFPTPWRIDGEFGFGPSRQIMEDWQIPHGKTETIRYRVIVSEGELDKQWVQQQADQYQRMK